MYRFCCAFTSGSTYDMKCPAMMEPVVYKIFQSMRLWTDGNLEPATI